jgi:hypothetical protein
MKQQLLNSFLIIFLYKNIDFRLCEFDDDDLNIVLSKYLKLLNDKYYKAINITINKQNNTIIVHIKSQHEYEKLTYDELGLL